MDITVGNAAVVLDDLLVNAPQRDTRTVDRLLIDFRVFQASTSELEGEYVVDCGIGVINREAFDLGTGVGIPNPTVEDLYPPLGWLYVSTQLVLQALPVVSLPHGMWRETAHFKADVRAQRKVDKGILYMWLEQNATGGAPATLFAVGRVRVHFKN